MSEQIRIETAECGGFTMDFFRFGEKGAFPVVIIPGLSLLSVMDAAPIVARAYGVLVYDGDFQVFVMDRRKELPKQYTVEAMAEDTAKALRTIGIDRADLFGVSQGGMIAQVLACRHQDLVERMILGCSSPRVDADDCGVLGRWLKLAKAGKTKELMDAFAEAVYSESYVNRYRKTFDAMEGMVTEKDLSRFICLAEGMKGFDISGELEKVKCPTLAITAEGDRVFGTEPSREIAEKTGGQVYVYEGYSHAVFDETSDVQERMHRFFSE